MKKETLKCNFCGRQKKETKVLMGGGIDSNSHICDICIETGHKLVLDESESEKILMATSNNKIGDITYKSLKFRSKLLNLFLGVGMALTIIKYIINWFFKISLDKFYDNIINIWWILSALIIAAIFIDMFQYILIKLKKEEEKLSDDNDNLLA
jgi:hypothetical protein